MFLLYGYYMKHLLPVAVGTFLEYVKSAHSQSNSDGHCLHPRVLVWSMSLILVSVHDNRFTEWFVNIS